MSEAQKRDPRRQYSVPIGGIGAGSLEPGPDGRFRDITINNNRGVGEAIKISKASFMAIRVGEPGATYQRILQVESSKEDRYPDLGAPLLSRGQLVWRGLYPRVDYSLKDPDCPIQVVWSVFGPIVPFDHDASILPICCMAVRCSNPTDEELDVSVVLNWENLIGRTATRTPDSLARIMPTEIEYIEKHKRSIQPTDRKTGERIGTHLGKDKKIAVKESVEPPSRYNGLVFGGERAPRHNADGMYCVAGRPDDDIVFSVLAWDHEDPADRERFWYELEHHGEFFRADSNTETPRSGAVCGRFKLPPEEARRVDHLVAWYCPRLKTEDESQGMGYTNLHKNAIEIAKNGMKHLDYYASSVDDWHKRIKSSSFPNWLNTMIINATHIYTTNAAYRRDGRFILYESANRSEEIQTPDRLYTSLGTLLWYPRFEESEMNHLARIADEQNGRLLPDTNTGTPFNGNDILAASTFVLSAYRNYRSLGNLARIKNLMPALKKVLITCMKADLDKDALPEAAEPWYTYDGIQVQGVSSFASGLWIAALRAFSLLSHSMRQPETAAQFQQVANQATKRFEQLFWDEPGGYYRLFVDPSLPVAEQPKLGAACHTGQLAGQWYADFLGLGSLFDRSRIVRALETMEEYNERTHGIASAMMPDGSVCKNPDGSEHNAEGHYAWPGFTNAHYTCLQIHRGQVERALRSLEKFYRNTLYKNSQQYDQPEKWDLVKNAPVPDSPERHAGALSIWYVLYALQGLSLDVPDQRLRVMPNLPKGTHTIEAPMFTPSCLGRLRYQEDALNGYRQRIHVSFDSPVSLKSIELRVPANTGELGVLFEVPDGRLPVQLEIRPFENARLLTVRPERPIIASSAVSVHVFTKKT